jgi:hypothetical protein
MVLNVIVRDAANNPQPFSSVAVDFCNCPGVHLCPPQPGDPYTIFSGCRVVITTKTAGAVAIPILGSGACNAGVGVFAAGLASSSPRSVSSPWIRTPMAS